MSLSRCYPLAIALAGFMGFPLHPTPAAAQSSSWTTPSAGYVYDSYHRTIRVLTGFVGAAVLGPSVADEVDWVSIAPNHKSALARRNGVCVWIPDLAAAEQSQTLDDIPGVREAFWASDSSRVVVLTERAQLVWLAMSGLAPIRVAGWEVESQSHAGLFQRESAPILLAADSGADKVILASRTGSTWQVRLASTKLPPVTISFSGHPVAATFSPDGVFVADAAAHQIVRIQNPEIAPASTPFLSSATYVGDPSAMVLSTDAKRLFLADRSGKMIRVFDSVTAEPIAQIPTDEPPDSLKNIAADCFLLITQSNRGPGETLFFLNTQEPAKISFVPGGN